VTKEATVKEVKGLYDEQGCTKPRTNQQDGIKAGENRLQPSPPTWRDNPFS
jgi:hypothetical protein